MLIGCNQNTGRSQRDDWETGRDVSAWGRVSAGCRHAAERCPCPTPASAGERSFPRCQDVMAADVTLWVPSSLAGKQETHRLRAWLATPSEPVWTSEALHEGPSPGGTQGHQGSVTS